MNAAAPNLEPGANGSPAREVAVRSAKKEGRRLARIEFDRDLRLADVCSRRALRFGITAEIGAGGEYDTSQAFASDAARAGFDGIRWWLRHDPGQRLVGIALFGPAGAPPEYAALPRPSPRELDEQLLDEAGRKFGYRALPRP